MLFKVLSNEYILGVGEGNRGIEINQPEFDLITFKFHSKPKNPDGYEYCLRADTLEWELVELPPAPEYEPNIEDKAKAYDILMGEEESE